MLLSTPSKGVFEALGRPITALHSELIDTAAKGEQHSTPASSSAALTQGPLTRAGSKVGPLVVAVCYTTIMKTSPTRVNEDLFASAQLVGSLMDRSAAQQISHWARIGREIECGASISHRAIVDVLTKRTSYDQLTTEEQAIVRAEWSERMEARRAELNLGETLARKGRSYAELDEDGQVVVRARGGRSGPKGRKPRS